MILLSTKTAETETHLLPTCNGVVVLARRRILPHGGARRGRSSQGALRSTMWIPMRSSSFSPALHFPMKVGECFFSPSLRSQYEWVGDPLALDNGTMEELLSVRERRITPQQETSCDESNRQDRITVRTLSRYRNLSWSVRRGPTETPHFQVPISKGSGEISSPYPTNSLWRRSARISVLAVT